MIELKDLQPLLKNTDYRRGNYVMTDESTDWHIIHDISEDLGVFNPKTSQYDLIQDKEIEPIPLTPEILEKVGFDKIEIFPTHPFYSLSKSKGSKCNIDIFLNKKGEYSSRDILCKYLHQLQNVYYWNTGEELQINLKDFITVK